MYLRYCLCCVFFSQLNILRLYFREHNRKAWLFANTPQGARAGAIIYSIVETAKANELNPYYYLRYLFERIPNIDLTDENALDRLLP